jgi:hypothetical protein
MNQSTIYERLKDSIGHLAWLTFLWSIGMTEHEYHIAQYEQAMVLGDPREATPSPRKGETTQN